MGDINGIEISNLDICRTKTGSIAKINGLRVIDSNLRGEESTEKRSTVHNNGVKTTRLRMSGLGVTSLSLCCKGVMEKGSTSESTVDHDGVGTTKLKISGLGVTGSNLRYEKAMKKRSTVDDNGIEINWLRISGLRKTGLSLRCNGRLRRRRSFFKSLPAHFCIKSSILLCQRCIVFF